MALRTASLTSRFLLMAAHRSVPRASWKRREAPSAYDPAIAMVLAESLAWKRFAQVGDAVF